MKQEEKLEEAKRLYKDANADQRYVLEILFPELVEIEDVRIRKEIIAYFKADWAKKEGITHPDWIAWLEKQGGCEQDFIDGKYSGGTSKEWTINDATTLKELIDFLENGTAKLQHDLTRYANWLKIQFTPIEKKSEQKPKFKVGDWIVSQYNNVAYVESSEKYYNLLLLNGFHEKLSIDYVDRNFHLWTIEDAREGDVLFQDLMCGKTFIYNGVNLDNAILYSFLISNDGEDVLPYHIGKPNTGIGFIEENKNIIYPATKEQCDLLFAKMKEEGYEWDSEKKEVNKIEDEEYIGKIAKIWKKQKK